MREEVTGEGRRHLAQLNPLLFAPGEKVLHGTAIGTAVMGVGEAGREELAGGEDGILSGALHEGWEGHRRALVRGTIELTYRTITTFIVLYRSGWSRCGRSTESRLTRR